MDRDYAVFGEASFDLTDKLTVTAGVRVFKADNSLVGFFGYGAGYGSTGERQCFAPAIVEGSPCTNLDKRVDETGKTYKLNLTYQIDGDRMVYATYSRAIVRPESTAGARSRPTPPTISPTMRWAGRRPGSTGLCAGTAAVYWDQWKDFQFSFLGANGLTEIRNANQAEMKGIETDINWRVTEALTVFGSAAYTDAKLTDDYCGFNDPVTGLPAVSCADPQAPAGTQLPITSKFKSNLTARYDFPVAGFDAHVQGSLVYQSSAFADLRIHAPNPVTGVEQPIRSAIGKLDGYATVDLTTGIARDNWSITAYVKNVTDELGEATRSVQCTVQICTGGLVLPGRVYSVPITPRIIGVRFGQKF